MLDFSQVQIIGNIRSFGSRFFNIKLNQSDDMSEHPLLQHIQASLNIPSGDLITIASLSDDICDIWEEKPVFLSSNDDIYNLGHFSEDLITTWAMVVMSNR